LTIVRFDLSHTARASCDQGEVVDSFHIEGGGGGITSEIIDYIDNLDRGAQMRLSTKGRGIIKYIATLSSSLLGGHPPLYEGIFVCLSFRPEKA
jgi:hypothetical protein